MWLTRFSISRPVITAMVFIALAIFGTISFYRIGRSANPPNTDFPIVVVYAGYPGASPQEMERLVVKPIEDQLDGIDGLDQMSASAQEGVGIIVVQFKLGTNLDIAAINVQSGVDTARVYLPADLNPPSVEKNGASQPLLDLAVSSKSMTQTQLADFTNNKLEPLLKGIPNVQTVDVRGAADREFHVEPIPERLVGANATLGDVFAAVAANNANLPGGILRQRTQETSVSVHAEINTAQDLLGIPLMVPGSSNKNMKIGDVAYAFDSHVEPTSISHFNGEPRIYVELGRNIAADEITSTKVAREQIKKIEEQFPEVSLTEIDAPADYTQKSLNGVWQSLIEGIVLTMLVMLLFLHAWRNAIVIMIAIPSSILATFVLMKIFAFHLDTMSLMGLSLIIGILVDDSIVVLENITRHRDLGEEPIDAAINGRSEIGSAAVAITMVDVVVFLPIAFLPGIVGAYLREFGAVIVISTLFSLLVSFTLTPLLAARWSVLKRSKGQPAWMEHARISQSLADPDRRRGSRVLHPVADGRAALYSADYDRRSDAAQLLGLALRADSNMVPDARASVRARARTLCRLGMRRARHQLADARHGCRHDDDRGQRRVPRPRRRLARSRLDVAAQGSRVGDQLSVVGNERTLAQRDVVAPLGRSDQKHAARPWAVVLPDRPRRPADVGYFRASDRAGDTLPNPRPH